MTDTIEVEVDGVVDDGTNPRTPAWGLPAAIAVVSSLALVVVVRVVLPGILGTHEQVRSQGAPRNVVASPREVEDDRIATVQAALAAWGRFAASGELRELAGVFNSDGPQYRQLAAEPPARADGDHPVPYTVRISDPTVLRDDGHESVVSVTATWTRSGEPEQRLVWEVVLRSTSPGRWTVWTVREPQPAHRP